MCACGSGRGESDQVLVDPDMSRRLGHHHLYHGVWTSVMITSLAYLVILPANLVTMFIIKMMNHTIKMSGEKNHV